ncbi:MAG: ATP-binding cassette domain-containing protein [Lachnospiraceae bacterium]|nr:ATP-binding cassette domain-containing protein [Lachnospiraceae bacterium]
MSILTVKGLRKDYEDFVLEDMNMNIEEGKVLGFVGANGAGKTTTIKSILNTIKPDGGTITIFGKTYEDSEREIKENIGVVLDDSFLPDMYSPKDVGTVMGQMYDNWDQSYYEKLIRELDIPYTKKMQKEVFFRYAGKGQNHICFGAPSSSADFGRTDSRA